MNASRFAIAPNTSDLIATSAIGKTITAVFSEAVSIASAKRNSVVDLPVPPRSTMEATHCGAKSAATSAI